MIRWLLNLSFRYKMPLWGALLIIISTLLVSGALIYRSYYDLKSSLVASAGSLGSTMAQTLIPPLLHNDAWHGFEIVRAPFKAEGSGNPIKPEIAMVVTLEDKIFVSSDPGHFPMLRKLTTEGQDFTVLADTISAPRIPPVTVIEPRDSSRIFIAVPIISGGSRLGTLVLIYSRSALRTMFMHSALNAALTGLIVLSILLPINWYWGQRMVIPLVRLAQLMDRITKQLPVPLEPKLYNYRDELGQVSNAYNHMVEALREKALLEQGIMSSERLAAVGRLSAVIAHEINNPLAGMLTALDTLKQRCCDNERNLRTIGLLERGLIQIRNTMSVLLVEVRQQRRDLSAQDVEDVQTLTQPIAMKHGVDLKFDIDLPQRLSVSAGPIRQLLINLLSNAIQAAMEGGWVHCEVALADCELRLSIANSGGPIPPEQMLHLFEPFVSYREGGHGLGLWVSYQLIQQLSGQVEVACDKETVFFTVTIPIEESEIQTL